MPITQNENAVLRLLERVTRWLRGFVWLNTAPMDWLQHPDHDVPSSQWDQEVRRSRFASMRPL
jgi:hypothetical protein